MLFWPLGSRVAAPTSAVAGPFDHGADVEPILYLGLKGLVLRV